MKLIKKIILALVTVCLLAGCANSTLNEAAAVKEDLPYFWKITKGQSTVYLMGTFHIVDDSYQIHPEIMQAFEESDRLAVEMNLLESERVAEIIMSFSTYSENDTITSHLSEEGTAHLESILSSYGYEMDSFSQFTPFYISILLSGLSLQSTGLTATGPDMLLLMAAQEKDMEIIEIEDPETMYAQFNTLTDEEADKYLIQTLKTLEESTAHNLSLYEAYKNNQEEELFKLLSQDAAYLSGSESYREMMLTSRNQVMVDSILSYLEEPVTTFVAVGTAHYFDKDGILALLEEAGITVEVK